ncbi:MAG TPA: hypothetical protein VJ862_06990 [Rhodanobacteraceae bacterium]|nr:hypothetical protein [Rhodanobacteraceae bacterium]
MVEKIHVLADASIPWQNTTELVGKLRYELPRAASDADTWWASEFVPGMLDFNPCEATQDAAEIVKRSRSLSAGVPGYFSQLWVEAQRLALRGEDDTATLTLRHFEAAAQSQAIREMMAGAAKVESDTTDDARSEGDTASNASIADSRPRLRQRPRCHRFNAFHILSPTVTDQARSTGWRCGYTLARTVAIGRT